MFRFTSAGVALVVAGGLFAPLAAQDSYFGPGNASIQFGATIPNTLNEYVVSNNGSGPGGLTLALAATTRCASMGCGPLVTNDAGSTFFAAPGFYPSSTLATWNIDFAVVPGGNTPSNLTYVLSYDFNPAVGNTGDFGQFNVTGDLQDSENMGFSIFATGFPNIISPPSFSPFDPNANGEYAFRLDAYNVDGLDVAFATAIVDVGTVNTVPEPATMSMLAIGLVGMAGAARRKKGKH